LLDPLIMGARDCCLVSCGCSEMDFYWTCWTAGYKWRMLSFGTYCTSYPSRGSFLCCCSVSRSHSCIL